MGVFSLSKSSKKNGDNNANIPQSNTETIHSNRTPSSHSTAIPLEGLLRKPRHTFRSYRLKGEYDQPWVDDERLKRIKYGNWIVMGFVFGAFCIIGYLIYDGAAAAKIGDYCLIMDDDFRSLDSDFWTHEVQTGGFGTGEFDWTTSDSSNSFTDGEGLHIVPTLTTETTTITDEQLFNGYTLNLTQAGGDGSCTSSEYKQCSVRSNDTTGAIVPPVRSARLTTKGKRSIKYGRVEVVAKMPRGDWLWPAIWMMPEESKYGQWPASGEIDIAELRGNSWKYPLGRDSVQSTIHWGPNHALDASWSTYGLWFLRRTDYSDSFHTFGLEWTKDYMFMYLGTRLKQVFYMEFADKKTLWEKGGFEGQSTSNGTVMENPWASTGNPNTPFDENFYLILNVAVGAQNGWFYDGKNEKPWVDGSPTAARDFYKAKEKWLPTWGEGNSRGMTVKSVKMWQQGKC